MVPSLRAALVPAAPLARSRGPFRVAPDGGPARCAPDALSHDPRSHERGADEPRAQARHGRCAAPTAPASCSASAPASPARSTCRRIAVRICMIVLAAIALPLVGRRIRDRAAIIPRDDGRVLLGGGPADRRETLVGWSLVGLVLIWFAGAAFRLENLVWPALSSFGDLRRRGRNARAARAAAARCRAGRGRRRAARSRGSAAAPAAAAAHGDADRRDAAERRRPTRGRPRPRPRSSRSPPPPPAAPAARRVAGRDRRGRAADRRRDRVPARRDRRDRSRRHLRGRGPGGRGRGVTGAGAIAAAALQRRGAITLVVLGLLLAGGVGRRRARRGRAGRRRRLAHRAPGHAPPTSRTSTGSASARSTSTCARPTCPPGATTVRAQLRVGELTVLVPRGVRVESIGPTEVSGVDAVNRALPKPDPKPAGKRKQRKPPAGGARSRRSASTRTCATGTPTWWPVVPDAAAERHAVAMDGDRLRRSGPDRMVLGVCGGLAEALGVDSVLVRLGFALAVPLGGIGVAAYVMTAALMGAPEPGSAIPRPRLQQIAGPRAAAARGARRARPSGLLLPLTCWPRARCCWSGLGLAWRQAATASARGDGPGWARPLMLDLLRALAAIALLIAGALLFLAQDTNITAAAASAIAAAVVAAGIGLLVGPRLRRAQALASAERRERIRTEERVAHGRAPARLGAPDARADPARRRRARGAQPRPPPGARAARLALRRRGARRARHVRRRAAPRRPRTSRRATTSPSSSSSRATPRSTTTSTRW